MRLKIKRLQSAVGLPEPATAHVPVLMLTARGQAKDRELAERLGVTQFMTKPFSNAEVLAAVRRMVTP